MFTGLVTALGTVRSSRASARALTLTIAAPYRGLAVGESIAVDGVCLTVVSRRAGAFTVEVIGTTRGRTKLGGYRAGRVVNLERSLRAADRLGGHVVAGHVDGVGTVASRRERGDDLLLDIRVPRELMPLVVPRGSLAVDGVSLTIAARPRPGIARVALVPHTRSKTTLGGARPGARVHLEADLIGKYVRQLLRPRGRVR